MNHSWSTDNIDIFKKPECAKFFVLFIDFNFTHFSCLIKVTNSCLTSHPFFLNLHSIKVLGLRQNVCSSSTSYLEFLRYSRYAISNNSPLSRSGAIHITFSIYLTFNPVLLFVKEEIGQPLDFYRSFAKTANSPPLIVSQI